MKLPIISPLAASILPIGSSALCLLPSDAKTLSTNFGKLISNYSNKLANETLTPNFVDHSESVNTLIDSGGSAPQALLGNTFSSRAQFEAASAAQPAEPFTLKNMWFDSGAWLVNLGIFKPASTKKEKREVVFEA
ncbi:hypothetical protein LTR12_004770 [Friedmanniomyces endolithicus]|nr:hypothetical protein LTR12_004770 [Friedmanniomyces endolithicus]